MSKTKDERKIHYGVEVSKIYDDLTYEQLVQTLKETEDCTYDVDVKIYRGCNKYGDFDGTYRVSVVCGVNGLADAKHIKEWVEKSLESIDYYTK